MTRLFSKSFGIVGAEKLDIKEATDPWSPYFGRVPIPPLLDAQLDKIWRDVMDKGKKAVLKDLRRRVLQHKLEDWLESFLVMFIWLLNVEFSYRHQCKQLDLHKRAVCTDFPHFRFLARANISNLKGTRIPFFTQPLLGKWEWSADNILAHFQIICNGQVPFHLASVDSKVLDLAQLDLAERSYVTKMAAYIAQERKNN